MSSKSPALQSGLVAVADAPSSRPPTPEECDHPEPVIGVMAHEFAFYDGARGPEGTRRTVTSYGPVIGGLPIRAWHCEKCGLLRLAFPDGRTEERRLYPGPQPGLLAEPTPLATERVKYGMQARVSGLSATPAYIEQLVREQGLVELPLQLPRIEITLPPWDAVTWLTVGGLVAIIVELFLAAVLAVYTYSTPVIELPLVIVTTGMFVGLLFFRLGAAAVRHLWPAAPLRPSIAESARGTPQLDAVTRTVVTLMVIALIGLFAAGVLAVYSLATPGAEAPVFVASMVCAVLAAVLKLGDAIWRHFGPR